MHFRAGLKSNMPTGKHRRNPVMLADASAAADYFLDSSGMSITLDLFSTVITMISPQ